ncbi:MAG: hypothetical protein AAF738_06805, partial [Bacteroidota bacterium]
RMKRNVIVFFSFLLMSVLNAQSDTLDFPADWVGEWKGALHIYTGAGLQQTVDMELHILPIDTSTAYTWTIIYGEDKVAGQRPYQLKTVDAQKGHYRVDEQNSILLDAYLLGGKLFERFSVMGNLLLATTEVRDETMYYEIVSGTETSIQTTGDTVVKGDTIPPVAAFSLKVRQCATLKRIP